MFQFPGSAFSYPMNSDMDTTPLRVVGFPIRRFPNEETRRDENRVILL